MTKYYGFLRLDALTKRGIDYGFLSRQNFDPQKYDFNAEELRLFLFGPGLVKNTEFMELWNNQDYVTVVVHSRG